MTIPRYYVRVVKAVTKNALAERVHEVLEPIEPDDIISVTYAVDVGFPWPFRRNSAILVFRPVDDS